MVVRVEPFNLPYFREALAEILLLAIPCGLIGSWIVLRGLEFHSHAVGTATFPGLVLADGLGFAALPGAFVAAFAFTLFSVAAGRSRRTGQDVATALALSGCLAAGVILASDVFGSGAGVDTMLFGSLLAIDSSDLWLAGATAALTVFASLLFGSRWLAEGFDPGAGPARSPVLDGLLAAAVAIVVVSSLGAVGALLVSALVVVPAATVRLFARRVPELQFGTIALVAAEGIAGLWLSAVTDAPPGATIAVVSGVVFLLSFLSRTFARRRHSLLTPLLSAVSVFAVVAAVGIGSGCGPGPVSGSGPRIVATTTQAGDLVREIGGQRVRLTTILTPNTDPHEYEPRPSDIEAMAAAALLFRSGGPVDSWSGDLRARSGHAIPVVNLGRKLPLRLQDAGRSDPHWWQDPVNVAAAGRRTGSALARQNPPAAAYYRRRARDFARRAGELTARIRACVARIPPRERRLVTDHDAFAYFTRRFGLRTVGTAVPALSAQASPSAGDLARLERTIRSERVRAVFPERATSPALTEALARDTGATVGSLLYGDALGPSGSTGETLLGSIEANADAVIRGISGGRINCFGAAS